MTTYKPGDRVRLRDGVLPWIAKRDGWTVEAALDEEYLIEHSRAHVYVDHEDVEPGSPPITPEPKRVVGQAWRDAEGRTVVTVETEVYPYYYICEARERMSWLGLDHPLTPLYPVPDPDDGRAVEAIVNGFDDPLLRKASIVRAVLRTLRCEA